MRPIIAIAGLAVAVAALPATSDASCPRRATGTVAGAVAGGLLGSAVAGHGARTEGALLGAAAGGFAGNQLTKCRYYPRRAYHRTRSDQRASYDRPAYANCRYETRDYYDPYGQVVRQPMRVCGR